VKAKTLAKGAAKPAPPKKPAKAKTQKKVSK
jgi:hypothetical protein